MRASVTDLHCVVVDVVFIVIALRLIQVYHLAVASTHCCTATSKWRARARDSRRGERTQHQQRKQGHHTQLEVLRIIYAYKGGARCNPRVHRAPLGKAWLVSTWVYVYGFKGHRFTAAREFAGLGMADDTGSAG